MSHIQMTDELIGRQVYGSDGKKLGKLISADGDELVVEKGLLFRRDYAIFQRHVASADAEGIRLDQPAAYYVDLLESGRSEVDGDTRSAPRMEARGTERASEPMTEVPMMERGAETASASEEILRVPVVEEQLDVDKTSREMGAVHLRKEVVTEQKTVSVPVSHEEVTIERVPMDRAPISGEATFQQQTVSVPVHEEEVELHTRPVVKEEIRVSKHAYQTEQRADATVRHEEVEIEPEGKVGRAGKDDEGKKLI